MSATKNTTLAVIHNTPIHYKHALFQAMRKEGVDFEVLFLASQSSIRHELIPLSQELYRHRIAEDGPYEDAKGPRKAAWTWSSLNAIRPRVVIVSSYASAESWAAWLWALLNRIPVVMWFASNEFDYKRHWIKELPKRLFVRGLAGAHAYGKSSKAYLVKLGLDSHNIAIKRTVLDIHTFDTHASAKQYRSDGTTRLLYVGRLAEVKNVSTLVDAFATAVKNASAPLRLVIAGTGPCEASLREEVRRRGIEALVEFRGYVYQKDLPALYREADAFVLPSIMEPWGLVALEAMLCRLPILISTQCGCAADVVNSETGWSFSPWDGTKLTTLINQLSSLSTEQLKAMGDAAHDVASVYSPENSAHVIAESVRHLKDRSSRNRRGGTEFAR